MKKEYIIGIFAALAVLATVGFFLRDRVNINTYSTQKTIIETIKEKPLDKYTIENLSNVDVPQGTIQIDEVIKEEDAFNSNLFFFEHSPDLTNDTKKVSGQINTPTEPGKYPLALMLRGYVDQNIYITGDGTRNAAKYLAQNGYITIAPDFLGYADSDTEAANIFETRFQTYTTTLALLKSLGQIENWDGENVFIWGHSNGGQIALTILGITGKEYPTTLWAPVSKPFPYSVLYYTDESEDRGKLIRRELAKYEDDYDTDLYSMDMYFDKINAPIQLHQGTLDDAVPLDWSNSLEKQLEDAEVELDYYIYTGADHNMRPSWDTVVQRDLEFFNSYLK